MHIDKALGLVKTFEATCTNLFESCSFEISPDAYEVRSRWFGDPSHSIPLAERNGVYIYSSSTGDVWYVGRGCRPGGGGIGFRACAHLGTGTKVGPTGEMFSSHDWVDDTYKHVPAYIQRALTQGDFVIRTIAVSPDYLCALLEVLIQTSCYASDRKLPPLNKQIG